MIKSAHLTASVSRTAGGLFDAVLRLAQSEQQLGAMVKAFGLRDESLMRTIPRTQFPAGVKVGGQLEGRGADGREQVFYVAKIKGATVILDGNHPLAGKALRFTLKVTGVRAASEEEITHGHVHGEHGHQH